MAYTNNAPGALSGAFARAAALALAFALLPAFGAFAQDAADGSDASAIVEDEDDIFGVEESVGEGTEDSSAVRDAFIQSAAPSLVGSYSGSAGLTGTWNDPWGAGFDLFAPDAVALAPSSALHLGFSAKPEKDLGFYGEVRTAYPFARDATVYDSDGNASGTVSVPDISVFNLYAKFDWKDRIFFSFGKQPLKWGLGYFFAPANDILALGAVNYDDLGADREGPLSLRVNAPIPGTMATAYLYAIMDSASLHPTEIGVAPKFEISFPGIELALAGYYQKDDGPRAIASTSFGIGDVNFFGEGVLAFGSEKWFVIEESRTVATPAIPPFVPEGEQAFSYRIVEKGGLDDLFFTGTVGLSYSKSWNKKLDLTVMAQYLYDGEGQANMSLDDMLQAVVERTNPFYDYPDDPAIDLSGANGMMTALSKFGSRLGQHYGGVSVSASGILGTDLSASVLALANLADLSGWVKPQLSWRIFDRMSVSGWASFGFGEGGDEFTNMGGIYKAIQGISFGATGLAYEEANLTPPIQLGLSFSLGSGSF